MDNDLLARLRDANLAGQKAEQSSIQQTKPDVEIKFARNKNNYNQAVSLDRSISVSVHYFRNINQNHVLYKDRGVVIKLPFDDQRNGSCKVFLRSSNPLSGNQIRALKKALRVIGFRSSVELSSIE